MKLILENEFTWDGIYGILDEYGNRVYNIDARIEEGGRIIGICDAGDDEKELASVRQKRIAKRPEYSFEIGERRVGTITRRGADYDISFSDWFVSGNLIQWRFRVVDKYGDIAESCIDEECMAFEIFDKKNALGAAVLMMGVAGLTGDLIKEYSGENTEGHDVDDLISSVESIAEKTADFGRKTWAALEKLYGVYEEPKTDGEDREFSHRTDMHDVAQGVEDFADKVEEVGQKTKKFFNHLYGFDAEQPKDKGRD